MATIREKSPSHWHVQIRRQGWPFQSATFKTKIKAQIWARKIEADMDQGKFVDTSKARSTTLTDLIKLYIEKVTLHRPSENSRVAEKLRLEKFVREEKILCSYAIFNLTPDHFEDYRDKRLKQQNKSGKFISPGTVKKELNLLKRVIDYRMRWLGLHLNPLNATDVKRPAVNDERNLRLSSQEIARLLYYCKKSQNILLAPFVELGFETGARRGSLLRLEWDDLNLQKRTALLRAIKNSRSPDKIINHVMGLTPRAIEIFKSIPKTGKLVFPMTGNAFRKAFNRAREKAELTHFRFHDTRHEFISRLFEAGWDMGLVMKQTGHRDIKSVLRYANVSTDHLTEALAKL